MVKDLLAGFTPAQILSGQRTGTSSAKDVDEAAWYAHWCENIGCDLTPTSMALSGGLQAPALAWVFVAGYQGAVRAVFPECPNSGWAAFAVSEDKHNPQQHPPMRLIKTPSQWLLQGSKSWVAQSRHVDHLIVTAAITYDKKTTENTATENNDEQAKVSVIVNRKLAGITIGHREHSNFLPLMSQGFAQFESVAVEPSQCLAQERIKLFMKSESKFITLAIAGWLYAQSRVNDLPLAEKFKKLAEDLADYCDDGQASITQLARLDSQLQAFFSDFEQLVDTGRYSNWSTDRGLVSIYSQGIARAAEKSVGHALDR